MKLYAADTKVDSTRSRVELEKMLRRYGATEFRTTHSEARGSAIVEFVIERRLIRFDVELPGVNDPRFAKTPAGKPRTPLQRAEAAQQEERRRWRALLLCVKAKLEIVRNGIMPFETEFLPYVVLPNDRTVVETLRAPIANAIEGRSMKFLAIAPPAAGSDT